MHECLAVSAQKAIVEQVSLVDPIEYSFYRSSEACYQRPNQIQIDREQSQK